MAAPVQHEFDPLRDLAGMWTTALAERYLPLPGHPKVKYECWDGRLFMSPVEVAANSYGRAKLITLMNEPARAAGLYVFADVNLILSPQRWIEPDVTVLHGVPSIDDGPWVPIELCTMPVEFVSTSSRRRDYIEKPARCAGAGVPYFMQVEIERRLRHASVTVLRLGPDEKSRVLATAVAGQELALTEPFELRFDPAALLLP